MQKPLPSLYCFRCNDRVDEVCLRKKPGRGRYRFKVHGAVVLGTADGLREGAIQLLDELT